MAATAQFGSAGRGGQGAGRRGRAQPISPFPSAGNGTLGRPGSQMLSTAAGTARRAGASAMGQRDAGGSSTGSRSRRVVQLPLECRRLTEGVPLYAAMRVPANEAIEVLSPVERPTLFLRSFDAAKALHGDRNKLPDSEAAVVVKYIVAAARAPVVAYYRDDPDGFNQIARVVAQSTESERQAQAARGKGRGRGRGKGRGAPPAAGARTGGTLGSTGAHSSAGPGNFPGATVTFSGGFPELEGADEAPGRTGGSLAPKASAKLRTGLDASAVPPHPDLRSILGSGRASLMLRRLVDGGIDGMYLPLGVLVDQGTSVLVDGKTPPPPPSAIPADPFAKPKPKQGKGAVAGTGAGRRGRGASRGGARQSDAPGALPTAVPADLAQSSVPRLALGGGGSAGATTSGGREGTGLEESKTSPEAEADPSAAASSDAQVLLLLRPHLHVVPHKVCVLGRGRDEARVALHFIATPTIDAAALTLGLPMQPAGDTPAAAPAAGDEAAQHAAVPPVFLGDGTAFMVASMAEARMARALREATLRNDEAAIMAVAAAGTDSAAADPTSTAVAGRSAAPVPAGGSLATAAELLEDSALVRQCREARQDAGTGGVPGSRSSGKTSARKSSSRGGGKASARGGKGGDGDADDAARAAGAQEARRTAMAAKGLGLLAEELIPATRPQAGDSMAGSLAETGLVSAPPAGLTASSRADLDEDAAAAVGLDADAEAAEGEGAVPTDVGSMLPEAAEEIGGRLVMLTRPDVTSIGQLLEEATARRPALAQLLRPRIKPTGAEEGGATGSKGDKSARGGGKASARGGKASSRGASARGGGAEAAAAAGGPGEPLLCEVWVNGRRAGSMFRWDTAAGTAAVRSAGASAGHKLGSGGETGPSAAVRSMFSGGKGKTLESLGLTEEVAAKGLVHVVVRVLHPEAAAVARSLQAGGADSESGGKKSSRGGKKSSRR